jgi:hypothetical protein
MLLLHESHAFFACVVLQTCFAAGIAMIGPTGARNVSREGKV